MRGETNQTTRQRRKQIYNKAYYHVRKAKLPAYRTYTVGPAAPGPYLAWQGQWHAVTTRMSPDGQIRLCILEDIGGLREHVTEKEPPHAP